MILGGFWTWSDVVCFELNFRLPENPGIARKIRYQLKPKKENTMTSHVRALGLTVALLALVLGLGLATRLLAEDGKADMRQPVQKIADALATGDREQAKKLAGDIAKSDADLELIMNLMGKRVRNSKKIVFGFSSKPGTTGDGIEARLLVIAKRIDSGTLAKEMADLLQMTYRVEAIAEIARQRVPEKDEGQKKRKDWIEWSDAMVKESAQLRDALKTQKAAAVKAAAGKLNASCTNCHGVFRE
jgi:hypothetical protein